MEIDNIIKREIISLVTSIVLILIIFIGVSFASFFSVAEGKSNIISFGDIDLTFCNDTTCSENSLEYGQTIGLTNVNGVDTPLAIYPYETKEEALETDPYIFTLTNTGDLPIYLSVYLEEDTTFVPAGNYEEYTKLTSLYANNLKVGVADCGEGIPNANKVSVYSYGSLVDYRIEEDYRLEVNDSVTYCVWTWLDENTPNDVQETYFVANISAEGKYIPEAPTLANKLMFEYDYFGLTQIEQSSSTEYRYQGGNPDNYVSFNDELWRIIGIFETENKLGEKDYRVKIIRDPLANIEKWDDSSSNWSASTLNSLLNSGDYAKKVNDYLESGLNSGYIYMADEVVWNLGNVNPENLSHAVYTSERSETIHSGNESTSIGRIGLMYPSDYGYASSACYSNKTLNLYNDSACTNTNWLDASVVQWTISPSATSNSAVVTIAEDGSVTNQTASAGDSFSPTLYLKPEVLLTGGEGTKEEPYTLDYTYTIEEKLLADNPVIKDDNADLFADVADELSESGLFRTTDLTKTEDVDGDGIGEEVLYFRGVVENNYLVFANHCWRIVRTNESGESIKLRYGGVPTISNGVTSCAQTGTASYITLDGTNRFSYGYNSQYIESKNLKWVHEEGVDSNAKISVETWYTENIESKDPKVSDLVIDEPYCNDMSIGRTTSLYTYHGAYVRLKDNKNPQYKCPNDSDKYTVSTSIGNGKLRKPIALLTADEAIYAGGGSSNNKVYYLHNGSYSYWLMSPSSNSLFVIDGNGIVFERYTFTNLFRLLPVISISNDAKVESAGTGEYNNPYIIITN